MRWLKSSLSPWSRLLMFSATEPQITLKPTPWTPCEPFSSCSRIWLRHPVWPKRSIARRPRGGGRATKPLFGRQTPPLGSEFGVHRVSAEGLCFPDHRARAPSRRTSQRRARMKEENCSNQKMGGQPRCNAMRLRGASAASLGAGEKRIRPSCLIRARGRTFGAVPPSASSAYSA
jgi:hypothetical protein